MAAGAISNVLVVDDEKNIRATLAVCLEATGCAVTSASTSEAALAQVLRTSFDLAFLDLRLGPEDGMVLLPRLLAARPGLAIVVITAYATIDTAVEAIKLGAVDYLAKPFTPAQIRHVLEQIALRRTALARVADLESQLADELPGIDIATQAPGMRTALELATRAAASDAPILVRGENGTGKGVLARLIHARSKRIGKPYVTVNCPTLSEELLASELFGHATGAFTGAVRDQAGRVEVAEGGTLLLDEIGEITPALQAKLLRFVQDKEFERVGETRTRRADVRVIAATNRDLEADVKAGRFREDLLFRLNVIEISVPSLRERSEDILAMACRFLAFFARAANRPAPALSPAAEQALLAYAWPGNIRELRNAMERATILFPERTLGREALPERIAAQVSSAPRLGGDFTLDQLEREHIERVVARAATLEDAAKILGIDASTLYRKRKKYES
ncbi:MAG TPA: sigma-54 dependent transcriptional regulator [Kofleriaceae bacterium]|jgi:NtrC-family two-component system response regulator AlgB|nr:sigma-54 dependent transcriptional regulator [Kofleriaceae bacterium]